MRHNHTTTAQHHRVRQLLAVVLAVTAAAVLATASPATASTHYCRTSLWQGTSEATIRVPAAAAGWRCYMGWGADSPAVTALQQSLNTCYRTVIGTPLRVDGEFGSRTRTALRTVQRHVHVRRDGIYGPQTALSMRHTAYGGGCDTLSHPGG